MIPLDTAVHTLSVSATTVSVMYNDGRFSPKMSVSQADMIMAIKIRANKSDKQDKCNNCICFNFML